MHNILRTYKVLLGALCFSISMQCICLAQSDLGMSEDRYQKKLEKTKKLIRRNPLNAQAHNYLGILYEKKEKHDWAIHEFKEAIKINERYKEALLNLANVYAITKEFKKAEQLYLEIIEYYPDYIDSRKYLAILLKNRNRHEDALLQYEKIIEVDPENVESLNSSGVIHFEKKRYEEAKKSFYKAIEADPDYADSYYNMGVLHHYYDKNLLEAKKYYMKYLAVNPKGDQSVLVQNLLMSVETELSEIEEKNKSLAINQKIVEKKEQINQEFDQAWEQKNYQLVKQISAELLKENNQNTVVREKLAKALFELKEYELSRIEYEEIIKIDPLKTKLYFEIAKIFDYHLNDSEKAIQNYQNYLRLNSNSEFKNEAEKRIENLSPKPVQKPKVVEIEKKMEKSEVKKEVETKKNSVEPANFKKIEEINKPTQTKETYYTFYNQGLRYQSQNKNIEALNEFEKSINLKKENPKSYFSMGDIYLKIGKKNEALDAFKNVTRYDVDNEKAYYNQAVIAKDLGKTAEAINAFNKTIQINSKFADAYLGLGLLYQEQKNIPKASLYLKKYVELKPTSSYSTRINAWLKSVHSN